MATPSYLLGVIPRKGDLSSYGVGSEGLSAGPAYDFPPVDTKDQTALLRALLLRQDRMVYLLEPDNIRVQYFRGPNDHRPGQVYEFKIPKWTRHWKLRNFSTGAGLAGTVYLWHEKNGPAVGAWKSGANTLPKNYDMLLGGDSFSDNSILSDTLYIEWDQSVSTSTTGFVGPNMTLNFEGRV